MKAWYNKVMNDRVEEKIDKLANALGEGFKEVNNRLDRVEGRLENVEGRLENVEGRLENVEGRLTIVEQKIDLLRTDVQELHYDYKKMLTRIEKLELQTFGSVQE